MKILTIYENGKECTTKDTNLVKFLAFSNNPEEEVYINLVHIFSGSKETLTTTLYQEDNILVPRISENPYLQAYIKKLFLVTILERALYRDKECLAYVLSNVSIIESITDYDFLSCLPNGYRFQSSGGTISNIEIKSKNIRVKLFAFDYDRYEKQGRVEEVVISKPVKYGEYKTLTITPNGAIKDLSEVIGFVQSDPKEWLGLIALTLGIKPQIIKLG